MGKVVKTLNGIKSTRKFMIGDSDTSHRNEKLLIATIMGSADYSIVLTLI